MNLKKSLLFLFCSALFFSGCDTDTPQEQPEPLPKYYTISYFSEFTDYPQSKEVLEGYVLTEEDFPTLEKNRYEFLGWYYENNLPAKVGDVVYENLLLIAKWDEISKVKYAINEYFENIDNDEYTLTYTNFRYDYADELTDAPVNAYFGFITKEFQQEKIKADGSTEINIYYDRKTYTISFDTDGGTSIDPVIVKYGQEVNINDYVTEKPGYILRSWTPMINGTITKDQTCTAMWKINIVTYTKNTYFENIDDDEYTLKWTRQEEGQADLSIKPYADDHYLGYKLMPFEEQKLAADGSTVFNIYYKRKICTANFYDKNNNLILTATGKYQQTLPEVTVDNIDFCTFEGWIGEYKTVSEGIFRQETEDFSPIYEPYKRVTYYVNHYYQNIEDDSYPETPFSTDIKYEQYGRETSAVSANLYGFKVLPFEQKIVQQDGSTVVEIYYERLYYTITFWDDEDVLFELTGKYEATVPEVKDPEKTHYEFKGWGENPDWVSKYNIIPESFKKNTNIYSVWRSLNIFYDVRHEFERLNYMNEYFLNEKNFSTVEEIENMDWTGMTYPFENQGGVITYSGYIGELTECKPVNLDSEKYKNYELIPFEQKILEEINGDSFKNDIRIYYVLKKYTFTFDLDGGGSFTKSITKKYGSRTLLGNAKPKKGGYKFYGWEDANHKFYEEIPEYIDQDRTFKAIWLPE